MKSRLSRGRSFALSVALGAVGLALFAWVLWRIDYAALRAALANANVAFVALVPLAIVLEQSLAAAKWKLLLAGLGGARLSRVFAANMAASVAGYVVPLAGSAVVRSWLVARCEGLPFPSVFATIAVDRLVDGAAFLAIAAVAILLIGMPATDESLRSGALAAASVAAAILLALAMLLAAFRRSIRGDPEGARRFAAWVPARWRGRSKQILHAFAEGIAWPQNPARRAAIVALAFCVKALAATHLLWAGLALGVSLAIAQYVLLMVLLGFVHVLSRFVRIPGTFVLAAAFLLELFGVDRERALAMALIVQVSAIVSITALGAAALAWFGTALDELKTAYANGPRPGPPLH